MSEHSKLDGLEVEVFRSQDGRLVVDISTAELGPKDVHPGGDEIPNICIYINEQMIEIARSGYLVVDGKEMPA